MCRPDIKPFAFSDGEAMYLSVLEALPQGIVLHEPDGKIFYTNPAAARILGLSLDQLKGLDAFDPRWHAIHEDGSPFPGETHPASQVLESHRELRGVIMGVFNPALDSYRWIEIDAFPQFVAGTQALSRVMVVFSDISLRRQTEMELRQSEEKYRLIFDYSPIGLFYFDSSGVILACNDRFVNIIGSSREKLVGLNLLHLKDKKMVAVVQKALSGEMSFYEDDYHSVTAEKVTPIRALYTPAVKGGMLSGGIGIIEDVTERKMADEARKEIEERLRTLSDNLPGGLVYQIDTGVDGSTRHFSYISGGVEKLHGVTAEEALGDPMTIYSQVLEEDRERLVEAEAEAVSQQSSFLIEARVRLPNGRVDWRLFTSAPRLLENGHLVWDGIELDITKQKQSEVLLKESEWRNNIVSDLITDYIFVVDVLPDLGKGELPLRLRWASDNLNRLTGRGISETETPEMWEQIINAEDWASFFEFIKGILKTGQSGSFECRSLRKTGEKRWVRLYVRPQPDKKGRVTVIVGAVQDITARKESEMALKQSENRFRELVDLAVDGILLGGHDGLVIGANQAFCRMVGLDVEDVLGKRIQDLPFDPDNIRLHPFRFDLLQLGQIVENQRTLIRPDGERVEVEMRTKMMPDGTYQTIYRDISERKRSEAALVESNELFALFMRYSPIYTFIKEVSATESRVLQASDNFVDMIGIPGPQMKGLTMDELFPAEFAAKISADDWAVISAGEILRLDEELNGRSYSTIKYPINQGQRTLLAGFTIDITDRKEAEAERARLQGQLLQAQKMESVGRLAGGVAHDFNNMLGVILGYTDLGLMKIAEDHPLAKYLREIRKAAERSSNLTRQLLAFARKQTVAPKVLDLNLTVEGMLTMLERLIGEDVELVWMPGERIWPVLIDPSQVDQILANLCVNARDAISSNGRITIETENRQIDEACCTLYNEAKVGSYVCLTVSDNGCGMDAETQNHLFEPFFTTKEMGRGTGLGLATIYGVVKQNNGFISVYSEPGQGSSLKIFLPRYRVKTDEQKPVEKTNEFVGGQGTILLVEDEPSILEMTGLMLKEFGYAVLMADTPGRAMETARQHQGEIDLLVTDVIMPEMNGRELARNLLILYPGIKRIFMSGYTAEVIAHHGVLEQGVHFIQKPFTVEELAAKVAEVIDGP